MIRFIALCRLVARENDAGNGPGASRADSLAAVIGMGGFAVLAIAFAAITGDA